jgi:ABC-type sugar transport system permease subunit
LTAHHEHRLPLRRIDWLPKLVLAPSFVAAFLFIYGLIAWNGYLSVSESRLLPNYEFAGLDAYRALFDSDRFHVAAWNLVIFACCSSPARWPWACCWRCCSTRRSAPRACCAPSTSTRWR